MLETFRQYGLERLAESGELARFFEAHARHFLAVAEAGERALLGPYQSDWLDRLEAERDNFRAVLTRCCDSVLSEDSRQDIGPTLARNLFLFWNMGGHMSEGADWLALMAGIAKSSATPAVVFCHSGAGYFKFVLGHRVVGLSLADRAIQLSEELMDSGTCGWARYLRACVLLFSGDFAACERDSRLAVVHADETVIAGLQALSRAMLGAALLNQGKVDDASEQLSRALELARNLRDCWVTGLCLAYSGQLAMQCGDHPLAEKHFQESIRLFEQINNHTSKLRPANLLGQLAHRQGDGVQARIRYERNLIAAREAGWLEHMASAIVGLAMAATLSKLYEPAVQLFAAADSLRSGAGVDPPPFQKAEEERQIAAIRVSLAASVFDSNWVRGTTMTIDEAVGYALSVAE